MQFQKIYAYSMHTEGIEGIGISCGGEGGKTKEMYKA